MTRTFADKVDTLEELALKSLPYGSGELASVIMMTNSFRRVEYPPYLEAWDWRHGMMWLLRQLPSQPPRTGDCAELLFDPSLDGAL